MASSKSNEGPPLVIRFLSGNPTEQLDDETRRAVRSHAMSRVRNVQRHQKKLDIEERRQRSLLRTVKSLCRCLPPSNEEINAASSSTTQKAPSKTAIKLADSYKLCPLCGHVQFSELSPMGKLDILQRLYPTVIGFLEAEFDPFGVMPELSDRMTALDAHEMSAIKNHAITFCSPGAIKSVVFPEAVRDPALCMSMLYSSYAYLASVRGWINPRLAFAIKTAAIQQINSKVASQTTATNSETVASIAYLATGTWAFGTQLEEVPAHEAGLEMLVKNRGLSNFLADPFGETIRKYLIMHHLLICALSLQSPSLAFEVQFENNSITSSEPIQESPLFCPTETFSSIRNSKSCKEEILQILFLAKSLINAVLRQQAYGDEPGYLTELSAIKSSVLAIISLRTIPMNYILESCCITTHIILNAIESRIQLVDTSEILTKKLMEALKKTDIGSTWGDMLGVLYWVAIIGSAASQGKEGHRFLDSTLGRAMFEMGFTITNFECAVRPIHIFADLQMKLKERAEQR